MISLIKKWLTKNRKIKVNHDARINRLSAVCDPLLDEDIGMLDKEQIKSEGFISLIDDKKCEIKFGSSNYSEKILLSSLVGFLLGFCLFINGFLNTWKVNERSYIRAVTYAKEDYGNEFYLNPNAPFYVKKYKYIANEKNISFFQYFHIRYMDNGFYKKSRVRKNLFLDGGFSLFFITMIIIHLWGIYFIRTLPPLVIDRKKQLFYTWRKEKMYVARYSQVDLVNLYNVLYVRIYGLDKDNKLIIYAFVPRIPNLIDDIISKKYLLAFMAKYLIQGKEAVSSVDFKSQSSDFPFRKKPKPKDWEQQIAAILTELDRLGSPKGATDPK